jgi:hypothetical protein
MKTSKKPTKGIAVESYRARWDQKKALGTIRLYSKGDAFIYQGKFTFTSVAEMRDFISIFLGRGTPVAFLPDSLELAAGPFPVGQRRAKTKKA